MKKLSAIRNPLLITVGVLGILSVGLVLRHTSRYSASARVTERILNPLEDAWYDFKFRLRPATTTNDVFVAKIDDASLEMYGRWPWARAVYREVLDRIFNLGADVVAFDAVFSEPEFQEARLLEAFRDDKLEGRPTSLEKEAKLSDGQRDLIAKLLPAYGIQVFGQAVKNHPKTVLGYIWQRDRSECPLYDPLNPADVKRARDQGFDVEADPTRGIPESRTLKNPAFARESGILHVENYVDNLAQLNSQAVVVEGVSPLLSDGRSTAAEVFRCPVVNRAEIGAWAKHQGFFNAIADDDGLFRRQLLVAGLESKFVPAGHRDFLESAWFKNATFFPSLSIKAIMAHWDSPKLQVEVDNGKGKSAVRAVVIERKDAPPFRIETLPDGSLPVNFYGSQDNPAGPAIPEFSIGTMEGDLKEPSLANRVSDDPNKPLKGKVVFIGPTAVGVYDLRPNPVQGNAAGVFLHATTAARILQAARDPKANLAVRFAPLSLSLVLLWTLGLVLGLALSLLRSLPGAFTFVGLVLGYLIVDEQLFARAAYAMDGMTVTLALFAVFLGVFAYRYFTEEKDRAFVKGAFEKYVSPDVVASIMDDPKKLNLGGQKKELSVMFSDVRGFTTISEKMGAAELATFMNNYLSPMTEIVIENRGTIDKYMGDAIMAIFGAPVPYEGHAAKAVDAGLQMLEKLDRELKPAWRAQGLPEVDIGVGVNTGDMSVGNMGSKRIFAYTVMGDSVNLGSRLEGITKEYKVRLIVSEFTRRLLGPEYVCRELDRVKVKGKKLPVTIFEVMGKGGAEDPALVPLRLRAQKFEAALALYYAGKFLEAESLFRGLAAEDATSAIYAERCVDWRNDPPAADWDGSWTMKTK